MKKFIVFIALSCWLVVSGSAAQTTTVEGHIFELKNSSISSGYQHARGGPFRLVSNLGETTVGYATEPSQGLELRTGKFLPDLDLIYLTDFE